MNHLNFNFAFLIFCWFWDLGMCSWLKTTQNNENTGWVGGRGSEFQSCLSWVSFCLSFSSNICTPFSLSTFSSLRISAFPEASVIMTRARDRISINALQFVFLPCFSICWVLTISPVPGCVLGIKRRKDRVFAFNEIMFQCRKTDRTTDELQYHSACRGYCTVGTQKRGN